MPDHFCSILVLQEFFSVNFPFFLYKGAKKKSVSVTELKENKTHLFLS